MLVEKYIYVKFNGLFTLFADDCNLLRSPYMRSP